MARNRLCRHTCLADPDVTALYNAIVERPTVDPIDFFGPERLNEIAHCPHCTSLVRGVYDYVIRVADVRELLVRLECIAVARHARDGKKPAERMKDLSFV